MNRRAALIGFGAAMVLLVVWFLLLWGPQGERLAQADKRTAAANVSNAELELRVSRLKAARGQAPRLQAEQGRLRQAIPDAPDLAGFILDANDAATAAGVDFLSISPAVPEQGAAGLPPDIKLAISVTGGYFQVLDYLDRLDGLSRIVVVDSLGLTSGGSGATLSVSVTARMFSTTAPQFVVTTTTTTVPPPNGSTTTTAKP